MKGGDLKDELALFPRSIVYNLNTYFDNCGNQPAVSAHYLNYCLQLTKSPSQALEVLEPHAKKSLEIGYFYSYCININYFHSRVMF